MRASGAWLIVLIVLIGASTPPAASQTIRDSAGVRIVENTTTAAGSLVLSAPAWRVATGAVIDREITESMAKVAWLSDSSVVVFSAPDAWRRIRANGSLDTAFAGFIPGFIPGFLPTWIDAGPGDSVVIVRVTDQSVFMLDPRSGGRRGFILQARPGRDDVRGVLADGSLLMPGQKWFSRGPYRPVRDSARLVRVHPVTGDFTPILALASSESFSHTMYPEPAHIVVLPEVAVAFAHQVHVRGGARGIYAADGTAFEVRVLTSEGRLASIFRSRRPIRPAGPDELRLFRAGRTTMYMDSIIANANRTVPAISRIEVSSRGTVWVQTYQLGDVPQDWTLFDSTGTERGRVTVPASSRVLAVGDHDVLIAEADASRRVSIVRYGVSPRR